MKNLSYKNKVVFLDFIVCLILVILSCFSLFFNEPFLILSIVICSVVSIVNSLLLVKSGEFTSVNGTSVMFVVFTFLRFFLMIVGVVISALVVYFTMPSDGNKYRYLMVLISAIPYFVSTFVLAFVKQG